MLVAGLLHDLGKLGVSNQVLDKPGPLTASEFDLMRAHTGLTHSLITPLHPLRDIAEAAASHHERLDGTGYHRALARERVPLAARVLAVADIFDSLTSDRPYREALDPDPALALIEREAGRGLDPSAIDALREAVSDRGSLAASAVAGRATTRGTVSRGSGRRPPG